MAFSSSATLLVKHMSKAMVKRMPLSTKSKLGKEKIDETRMSGVSALEQLLAPLLCYFHCP
jgi:hypothetical protein